MSNEIKITAGTNVSVETSISIDGIDVSDLSTYVITFKLSNYGGDIAILTKENCTVSNNKVVVSLVPDDTCGLFGDYEYQYTLVRDNMIIKSFRLPIKIDQNIQ